MQTLSMAVVLVLALLLCFNTGGGMIINSFKDRRHVPMWVTLFLCVVGLIILTAPAFFVDLIILYGLHHNP